MNDKEYTQTVQIQCYLKGFIDGLKLDQVSYGTCELDKVQGTHAELTISGGFNGTGDWNIYLKQIETIITSFPGCWLISLVNDCLDDVWELKIGIRLETLRV